MIVKKSFIHEDWDSQQRSGYNIDLLKLPRTTAHPIPELLIDHFSIVTGQKLTAIGFGPGGDGAALGHDFFGHWKIEPQEFINSEHCNRSTFWNGAIKGSLFCGLTGNHKASCVGKHALRTAAFVHIVRTFIGGKILYPGCFL